MQMRWMAFCLSPSSGAAARFDFRSGQLFSETANTTKVVHGRRVLSIVVVHWNRLASAVNDPKTNTLSVVKIGKFIFNHS